MSAFLHQLSLAAPFFGLVFIGYALMRFSGWPASMSENLSRFVFSVAMPAMLFHMMSDLSRLPPVDARLLIALRMAFPPPKHELAEHEMPQPEPLIVPLAIPMIAGPSALATVLLASRHSNGETLLWVGAVILACLINAALLLASGWFSRLFGKAGMEALERLMGLILTAIAVQMLITGIRIAFKIG